MLTSIPNSAQEQASDISERPVIGSGRAVRHAEIQATCKTDEECADKFICAHRPIASREQETWNEDFGIRVFYEKRLRRLNKSNCKRIVIPLCFPMNMTNEDIKKECEMKGITCDMAGLSFDEATECETPPTLVDSGYASDVQIEERTTNEEHVTKKERETEVPDVEHQFPFLDLPLELRLKIYGYLLPARKHEIITQRPHNGSFFSSPPAYSSQTLYQAYASQPGLTTYALLTSNFRRDFPHAGIHTAILRTCKQIHDEAVEVLYGTEGTTFDFGVHVDAVVPFWSDRCASARRSARSVRMAKEIPGATENGRRPAATKLQAAETEVWDKTCSYLRSELRGLRNIDLTVWSAPGSNATLPSANVGEPDESPATQAAWKEWEWTRKLLEVEALQKLRVTWWGFHVTESIDGSFSSWLGKRMVSDKVVKDRMVKSGNVIEGFVVLPGGRDSETPQQEDAVKEYLSQREAMLG